MERREFLRIACGFVGAWPLVARAQQPGNQRLIGILGADATVWRPWTGAFVAHLKELGWVEGDTAAIEYRWATGRSDRVSEIAAEFERRKVDVIVTYGSAVPVLRQTITNIPIVFAVAFDPVRGGLVQSLAHPAGNVTGVLSSGSDITERLKSEAEVAHLAYHDQLTGLANRALLEEHLDLSLARGWRGRRCTARPGVLRRSAKRAARPGSTRRPS